MVNQTTPPTIGGPAQAETTLKSWLWGLIRWSAGGMALALCGYIGLDFFDASIKEHLNKRVFEFFHHADIEVAREGHKMFIAADKFRASGDLAAAGENYKQALNRLQLAAEHGIPQAMTVLALAYHCGRKGFIDRDESKSIIWRTKAEKLGDPFAKTIESICKID